MNILEAHLALAAWHYSKGMNSYIDEEREYHCAVAASIRKLVIPVTTTDTPDSEWLEELRPQS